MQTLLKNSIAFFLILELILPVFLDAKVFQANGIKIGEVDQNSAIIWTRITRHREFNRNGTPFLKVEKKKSKKKKGESKKKAAESDYKKEIPEGKTLDDMEGSAPGMEGEIKITWKEEQGKINTSDWLPVEPNRDFTKKYKLTGLKPGHKYILKVETRAKDGSTGQTLNGRFRTAYPVDKPVKVQFVVVTGQDYPRRDHPDGHKIYNHMLQLDPDFFIHTGDIEYYDKAGPFAKTQELARFKWNRLFGLPNLIRFYNNVASYFIKDDHDTTKNDSWPGVAYGDLTWEMGLAIFKEQFPMGEKSYRTVRWGKDVQIWMVEGRDFRSPNRMEDGPEKTIWGKEQKQWFFDTVKKSDAAFRLLISPTPIVGPDRKNKHDNHSNEDFSYEGNEIRKFLASQKNMFVFCGDRHWQYISVDDETGVKEFSCGATSDTHASGWQQKNVLPEHKFLNVKGGFLSITIERKRGKPVLTARHYSVDGKVYNEDVNPAR